MQIMGSSLYLRMLVMLCCFNLNILTKSYPSMQPLCHEDENSALLQFKHGLVLNKSASGNPSAYPKVESWKHGGSANDCCWWDGVECDHHTGHVIGLDLSSSFLHGSINSSSSLFNLVHLRRLNLADNDFNSSQIPTQIGSLSRLRSLNLSNSSFSGQIPWGISSLSKLAFLDLSRYDDWYSDDSLLKLEKPSLRDLVQNLTKLKVLRLGEVNISSKVPSVLSNRSSLTRLSLWGCLLKGEFPVAIFHLPNLRILSISENKDLTGSLPEFHHSSPLEILNVGSTSFSGTLPTSIGNLKSISSLYLSNCNFFGTIPASLSNLTELSYLSISSNKLVGQIPSLLGNLTRLTTLDLNRNHLTGFEQSPELIPWQWQSLKYLGLSENKLQGSLPVPPRSTTHYIVSDNLLAGEIPSSICHNSSLSMLVLSHNYLNGAIPQCLANSSKALYVLNLGSNNFDGIIPQTFTTGIKMIDLSENQLHGQVPPSLMNCTVLEALILGNNHIGGSFPFWLGALPELQVLILRSNKFHGTIENVETNFTFPKLRIIDLSHNGFSGNLPSNYFRNLNAMKMVELGKYLSYMEVISSSGICTYSISIALKGTLRLYERIQRAFVALDLSNNKFCGEIPESLESLRGLQVLNISNNHLSGAIPPSLANLTALESLDLSQNVLSGEIPQQLVQLTFLEVLDVSDNHLTGPIPQGKQFNTFDNTSYDGNPGLCGVPLSKSCENSKTSRPPPLNSPGDETELPSGIYLMVILMGYGSGLTVGLVIGTTLTRRYHAWFVNTLGRRMKFQKMQKMCGQSN